MAREGKAHPCSRVVISRQESRVTAYTDVIIVSLRLRSRGSPANMSYKHLSIGKKIAAVFLGHRRHQAYCSGCFSPANCAACGTGAEFHRLHPAERHLGGNLLYDVSYVRRAQFALLMVGMSSTGRSAAVAFRESLGKVEQALGAYEATVGAEHERRAFNRVRQHWLQYLGRSARVDQLFSLGDGERARDVLFGSNAAYTELEQSVNALWVGGEPGLRAGEPRQPARQRQQGDALRLGEHQAPCCCSWGS